MLAAVAACALASIPAHAASTAIGGPTAAYDVRGSWHAIAATGTLPSARRELAAIYDAGGDRMIVCGGNPPDDGTYALDFATGAWTKLNVGTPGARIDPSAIYDPVRHRMILFGGSGSLVGQPTDVWVLPLDGSGGPWQVLPVSGAAPPARRLTTMIYDPLRDRMVLFGGLNLDGSGAYNDTWALSLSPGTPTWTFLQTSTAPAVRYGHVGLYDPLNDQLVIYGGNNLADTWALPLGATSPWTQLNPSGAVPPPLYGASAVYDSVAGSMVMFDGFNNSTSNDQTWELLLATHQWNLINAPGTRPHTRRFHSAVLRSAANQMVIFGGYDETSGFLNDTWEMELSPSIVPSITSFAPLAGAVGDNVTIHGAHFSNATTVTFNNLPSSFQIQSDQIIVATVPDGATTGPIQVVTPVGAAASTLWFVVAVRPTVLSAVPDSGRAGDAITIHGHAFSGTTQVLFGGMSSAPFTVLDDSTIVATIDHNAATAPIVVVNPPLTGTSAFLFHVLGPDPFPHLLPIHDVPFDQGGRVSLRWEASDLDNPFDAAITSYRVWRRSPLFAGSVPSAPPPGPVPLAAQATATDYWEAVAEIPAAFLQGYAYAAYTLSDSVADGNPYTAFFIQALTSDRVVFYSSTVDSGYSVDNLAPATPGPFSAVVESHGVRLHWNGDRDADLSNYRLYRGSTAGFVPDASTLVAVTADTTYFDPVAGIYYKVAADDVHGNTSGFALAVADHATPTQVGSWIAETAGDHVHLVWQTSMPGAVSWTLERSDAGGPWKGIDAASPAADGLVTFDDATVIPGERYAYRVRTVVAGAALVSPEITVAVPVPSFAIESLGPNPTNGHDVTLTFTLPRASLATVEVVDVAGRVQEHPDASNLAAGRHQLRLAARDLRPGIHFVRVVQEGRVVTARFVVTR